VLEVVTLFELLKLDAFRIRIGCKCRSTLGHSEPGDDRFTPRIVYELVKRRHILGSFQIFRGNAKVGRENGNGRSDSVQNMDRSEGEKE
jgi:hypothetical protein